MVDPPHVCVMSEITMSFMTARQRAQSMGPIYAQRMKTQARGSKYFNLFMRFLYIRAHVDR